MPRQDYEQRQEARRERLEARAEKLRKEASARSKAGWDALHAIPFGQPILVGHYSEKRDRNYRARACGNIDKSVELSNKADKLATRANSVGLAGISSDDPTAIEQLEEKLAKLEAKQAMMAQANKLVRKKDVAGLVALGFTPALAERACTVPVWGNKFCAYEPFQLSNNNATIRTTRQRIEQLKREAGREYREVETNAGFKLVQNTDENRIQLIFDDKPSAEIRGVLKSHGFRWAPSAGAWQRLLNNAGIYAAQAVRAKLEGTQS